MKAIILIFTIVSVRFAWAQDDGLRAIEWTQGQSYPESAVLQASQEEIQEKASLEQLQRQAYQTHELYQIKKVEAERIMAEKRRKIEDYKVQQDQFIKDVQSWQNDLAQIESRQAEVEREMAALSKPFSEQEAQVRQTRVSLEERRSQLNEKIKSLEIRKSDTFKMIEMANANMAKWNREMALNQTKIVELDMQVMEYERLALNIRSQIVEAQTRLTESRIERKKAEDESQLFKAALLKTQNELKQIQTEQQRAENEKRNAQLALNRDRNHYEVEMKKIESKIVIAKTAQSLAEGESKRIAAETESMRSRLLEMQAQGETADVNLAGAQTSLMQTRISLQQVRADLVRQLGTEEKSTLKNNSYAQQVRSLASMANTSELSEGVRPWVLKRVCTIRRQPAYSADKLGEAKTGDRIYASPDLDSGWVKILNASGSTAFIRSSCGQFQE